MLHARSCDAVLLLLSVQILSAQILSEEFTSDANVRGSFFYKKMGPGQAGQAAAANSGGQAGSLQAVVKNKEVQGGAPLDGPLQYCCTGGGGGSAAPCPRSAPAGRRLLRGPWAALQGGWPVHVGAPPLKRPHHALHHLRKTGRVMAAG